MTKAELVSAIAEKTELTKKDSEKALAAVVDSITEALKKGDKVALVGFGTFEVRTRAARPFQKTIAKNQKMCYYIEQCDGDTA